MKPGDLIIIKELMPVMYLTNEVCLVVSVSPRPETWAKAVVTTLTLDGDIEVRSQAYYDSFYRIMDEAG